MPVFAVLISCSHRIQRISFTVNQEGVVMEQVTINVEEAGRLLGLSRGSAYRAARTGELPVVRFGRRLLVSKAALERKLAQAGQKAEVRG